MKRIVVLLFSTCFLSCTTWKIIKHNFSSISDYTIFPARDLPATTQPFNYPKDLDDYRVPTNIVLDNKEVVLEEILAKSGTVAFLIIKNDSLVYEQYFGGYKDSSLVTIFSITKSITSALIGCAIADGYIDSVEDPVTKYIPEMKANGFDKVKIIHLLQMTSGIKYTKHENQPFGKPAKFYYTDDLRKEILKLRLRKEPCEPFAYRSGNTQILALILERTLQNQTISDYFYQKIWHPLGMKFNGSWSTDSAENGLEKAYSSINMTAIDLAKMGSLYLHSGYWNDQVIIPKNWIQASTKVDTANCSAPFYQYGWWTMSSEYKDYRAEGAHGQFLYINPALKIVIVRLGKRKGKLNWQQWKELLTKVAENTK